MQGVKDAAPSISILVSIQLGFLSVSLTIIAKRAIIKVIMKYSTLPKGSFNEAVEKFSDPRYDMIDKETGRYLNRLSLSDSKDRALHRAKKAFALVGLVAAVGGGLAAVDQIMVNESIHEPGQTYLRVEAEQKQAESFQKQAESFQNYLGQISVQPPQPNGR